jgi:hypothetical protein
MNFFRSPNIEFICTIPVAKVLHPITPMKEYKPNWVLEMAKNLSIKKQNNEIIGRQVVRCPGLKTLFKKGWVVYNWIDVYVTVNEDRSYEWNTNVDQKNISPINEDYFGVHPYDSFKESKFLSQKIPIFKVVTPWLAKIPKGYVMYIKGMPYQEHDMFTVSEGMMTSEYGIAGVNFPILWNKPGKYLIPAGMPLAHILCIEEKDIEHTIRDTTDKEIKQHLDESVIKYSRFTSNYAEIKKQIKLYS